MQKYTFVKISSISVPNYTSRDSHKARKPLFLQLETTKPLKKLKIEMKISEIFYRFFLKSPVSRIVRKNVKGGPFGIF